MTRGLTTAPYLGQTFDFTPSWDWYSATLDETVSGADAVESMRVALGGEIRKSSGRHGYGVRDEVMAGRRTVVAVSHGGGQARALVEVSGGDAVRVAPLVRKLWPAHRVTRVDSALDWDDPSAFAEVSGMALSVARAMGISTSVAGDWLDEKGGRTLYVGGTSSVTRLRVYEKGKQLPQAERPFWVRAELQVRPERVPNKLRFAQLDAAEVWGASPWALRVAELVTTASVQPLSMRAHIEADDARARATLLRQYGGVIRRWCEEYGDWETFGLMLGAELKG